MIANINADGTDRNATLLSLFELIRPAYVAGGITFSEFDELADACFKHRGI